MSRLRQLVAAELQRPVPEAATRMAEAVLARWGDEVACILFYGSRRRDGGNDGLLDFYVLTDDYRRLHRRRLAAWFNRLLPPNVLFMSTPHAGGTVRAKVAVISRDAFAARMRMRSLDTTLWTRFCQPCSMLHARDDAVADWAAGTIAMAARTAARWGEQLAGPGASAEQRWLALFAHTYRLELRPEATGRGVLVYRTAVPWFDAVTALVDQEPIGNAVRRSWLVRRMTGKPLNLMRLIKAAFTFDGGADYLCEKLGRHTTVILTPTAWQRRHPLMGAPVLLLQHRRARRREQQLR